MSLTIANECNAAALDGMTALLNGGDFRLLTAGASLLATLGFQTSGGAFQAASVAAPSVAQSNAISPEPNPVAGTIGLFQLRTAGGSNRITGTVGVGSPTADLTVTDNVIPADATEVSCDAGLQLSLLLSGAL